MWRGTLTAPPERYSLEETVLLELARHEEFVCTMEWRLLASCAMAIVNGAGDSSAELIQNAYQALLNANNPELEIEEERREAAIRRSIEDEVKQGPFVVRPLPGFDRNDTNVPGKVGRLVRALQRKIVERDRPHGGKR